MLQEIRTIVISIFFSLFVSTGAGLTQVTISQIVNELDQQLSKVNSDSEKYEIVYNTVNNFLAQAWVATNEGQYSVSKNNYLHAFELAENLDYEKKYWSFVLDSIHIKRRYSLVANLHFNYGLLLGAAEIKNERLLEYKRTIEIATRFGDFYNHNKLRLVSHRRSVAREIALKNERTTATEIREMVTEEVSKGLREHNNKREAA